MELSNVAKEFRDYVDQISQINESVALIAWDLRTGAPKKGVPRRSQVLGTLATKSFEMSVSDTMESFLVSLEKSDEWDNLDEVTQRSVGEARKEYDKNKLIPPERYKEFVVLTSESESLWEVAKEKSDFAMFQPNLERIVEFSREFAGYYGYTDHPYDALLDRYEPGVTVRMLDGVFGRVREALVALLNGISDSPVKPGTAFLRRNYTKAMQREISLYLAAEVGYDFEAGRLDESVHPFTIGMNPGDVRVTTRYRENDLLSSAFGTIHECGHGMYEQHISGDLVGTLLATGTSLGIHESQSLFLEKFVGQTKAFWAGRYAKLQELAEGLLDDISLDEFHLGVNNVVPSLIRTEADEVTYPLHIILRYELEKGLMDGTVKVADLPGIWRERMAEYLGVVPENDGEGVLQDVHWAAGLIGYFPSYALGYIYAAQIRDALERDLAPVGDLVGETGLAALNGWLTENIHKYGKSREPLELIRAITGKGVDPEPLIAYLNRKYSEIYGLDTGE